MPGGHTSMMNCLDHETPLKWVSSIVLTVPCSVFHVDILPCAGSFTVSCVVPLQSSSLDIFQTLGATGGVLPLFPWLIAALTFFVHTKSTYEQQPICITKSQSNGGQCVRHVTVRLFLFISISSSVHHFFLPFIPSIISMFALHDITDLHCQHPKVVF